MQLVLRVIVVATLVKIYFTSYMNSPVLKIFGKKQLAGGTKGDRKMTPYALSVEYFIRL